MNRESEIRLIKECLELKQSNQTQYACSSDTVDVERYTSKHWFDQELKNIFSAGPVPCALSTELTNPGDYIAKKWINNIPLLLVRDGEGRARAYANVCRHRASQLVEEGAGCSKRFSCPYHAWTYDLEGGLVGAPQFTQGFPEKEMSDFGLTEFSCTEKLGLVFVHPQRSDTIPSDFLDPEIEEDLKWLDLDNHFVHSRKSKIWNFNWKIFSEGGMEAYHFNVAHKNSLAPFFLGNLSTWEMRGRQGIRMILPKKSLLDAPSLPEAEWDIREMANVLLTVFPTHTFLVQPDTIDMISINPLSTNQTEVEVATISKRENSAQWSNVEDEVCQKNHAISTFVLDEDFVIGERIQSNIDSGIVDEINFARFESALQVFHREVCETRMGDPGRLEE